MVACCPRTETHGTIEDPSPALRRKIVLVYISEGLAVQSRIPSVKPHMLHCYHTDYNASLTIHHAIILHQGL